MRTRRAGFKQIDVKRALNAARSAGMLVAACTIGLNGQIRLVFREGAGGVGQSDNEWDDVLQ